VRGLLKNKINIYIYATIPTICQVLERDIVQPVHLLHDQLLLVDLDDERGVAFVSGEPELANRVL